MVNKVPYFKGGYATCAVCNKVLFHTRKEAKRHARYRHPGVTLNAYYCPFAEGWHYGTLPPGGREQARRALETKRKREDQS